MALSREEMLAMDEEELRDLVSQRFLSVMGRTAGPSEFEAVGEVAPAPTIEPDPAAAVGEAQPPAGLAAGAEEAEMGNPFTGDARLDAARAGIARQQAARQQGNIIT